MMVELKCNLLDVVERALQAEVLVCGVECDLRISVCCDTNEMQFGETASR